MPKAGALLPIGGIEYGHKGYAMALLVEALTMGLSGHGRADPIEGWTNEAFVQVLNPELFGGRNAFLRQMTWLADACRNAQPRPGVERVRLTGGEPLLQARALATLLEEIHEGRKELLQLSKDWISKVKAAPTAREAHECTEEAKEVLGNIFLDLIQEPWSGVMELQKSLRNVPIVRLDCPAVVLVATTIFLLVFLFAPGRGYVWGKLA